MPNQSHKELFKVFNDAIKAAKKDKIKPYWYKEVFDKKAVSKDDFLKFWGVKID